MLRVEGGRVIQPSLVKLLSEIRASDAFRFSEDPKAFLESLETETGDE